MKLRIASIAAVLLTAAVLSGQTSRAKDEAAIRAQMAGYAAARSAGSGAGQAAFYTADADEWGSNDREMTIGRSEIAKKVDLPSDPNRKMRLEPIRIDFLTDDIALVNCTYGGTAENPSGHVLYVMMKREGKWLIRSNRPQRFAPAAK